MKIIHILCAKIKPLAKPLFDLGQSSVRGIRLSLQSITPPHRIKPPHKLRISLPPLRGSHIPHSIAIPQTPRATKSSKPTLSRDARPGKNKEMIVCTQTH